MPRAPKYRDSEIANAAREYRARHHTWPTVRDLQKLTPCGTDRATSILKELRTTADSRDLKILCLANGLDPRYAEETVRTVKTCSRDPKLMTPNYVRAAYFWLTGKVAPKNADEEKLKQRVIGLMEQHATTRGKPLPWQRLRSNPMKPRRLRELSEEERAEYGEEKRQEQRNQTRNN